MKILPVELIRAADAFTIKNELISSIDLMERAASSCANWLGEKLNKQQKVKIFVGPGNNGGDGVAIARLLSEKGFAIQLYILCFTENFSKDFLKNQSRLPKNIETFNINSEKDIPNICENDIVIDAIFGSGLTRPIFGFVAKVIRKINESKSLTISIDIPSGLFVDKTVSSSKGEIVFADYSLSFAPAKLAFLLPENDKFCGEWVVLDIGLSTSFIENAPVNNHLLAFSEVKPLLKQRNKFAHKGVYGHALLVAGSYGKTGAAILSSLACLRSGAGLLTAHLPEKCLNPLQTAAPEVMVNVDNDEKLFSTLPKLNNYNAIGVGPGIGTDIKTQKALKLLIQESKVPVVFDADAINILAENRTWLHFLPKKSIFTPHPKEFERLIGKCSDDFSRLQKQREFAIKYQVVLILKGHYSIIAMPDGNCFFNTTGNPGMATAGSGDVLTGIILSLLAQSYSSEAAAILAVYLHGMAGDFAAKESGFESMLASDIIKNLGKSFLELKS